MGIGGVGAIVVLLIGLFLGVDPSTLLALLSADGTQQQTETRRADDDAYGSSRMPEAGRADPMRQFVSVVLADTEDVWSQLFNSMARTYDDPKLVLAENAPSHPLAMIAMAERRFPVRIRLGVPPGGFGQRHTSITA